MAKEETPANKNARRSPISAAKKKERQNEIKRLIQNTAKDVDGQRNNVETKRRKLAEIDSSKPEYEQLQGEVTQLEDTLMTYETQLEELQNEMKEFDEMVVDSGEGTGDQQDTDKPPVFVTAPNGTLGSLNDGEDSDDEGLFTLAQGMKAMGLNHDGKVVAWRQQDRSQPVIVRYGPENAAKYERSTAAREDIDFDEDATDQFGEEHRLGDEKINKKFIRKRREIHGVFGLAYNCDLHDLRPRVKGETRKVPPLEIGVKWKIDGQIMKRWEIRSSIRHIFSSPKKCDEWIYLAAQYHAARHQNWKDGKLQGKARSPTLDPNDRLSPSSEVGNIIKKEDANGQNTPPKTPMQEYREEWCEVNEIDPEKLKVDSVRQREFLNAWREVKNRY